MSNFQNKPKPDTKRLMEYFKLNPASIFNAKNVVPNQLINYVTNEREMYIV